MSKRGMTMPRRAGTVGEDLPRYYEKNLVLGEIGAPAVEFALNEELRRAILGGQRARRLQNISVRICMRRLA
jgi:hypothetical protein